MLVNANRLDTSPVPCVVDQLFPLVGLGWAHGPSYSGKSYAFGTKLALDVANGVPFFGHETIQGTVIFALGEGLQDAGIRIKAQLAHHAEEIAAQIGKIRDEEGDEAAEKFAADQAPYTDDALIVETEAFAMPFGPDDKPSVSMQQFIAQASSLDPVLVIYDAVADFAGIASITNDTSASKYVKGVKHLVSALNCFVLGIAHDTQKGDKMLGAGRFFNAADVMLAIKRQGGDSETSSVISEKIKYGSLGPAFSYTAVKKAWDEPEIDDHGFPTGKLIPVETHVVTLADDNPDGPSLVVPGSGKSLFAPQMLPALRDVSPPKSKRTGIKPATGLSLEDREKRVEALLAKPCLECGTPATRGCNPLPGSVFTTVAPNTEVHVSRARQPEMAVAS